jgi:hypothetical protein
LVFIVYEKKPMNEAQLERDLHRILGEDTEIGGGKRGISLTPCMQSLASWLQSAGTSFTSGNVPSGTVLSLMKIALSAALQYAEQNGYLPDPVLHWITSVLIPYVFCGSPLSPGQQELASAAVQIMTCLSKKP